MPFSLIVGSSSGNEIIPGWVSHSSPYTLLRSEQKFANRRKAKRHYFYTGWKIFRPEVIEMCRWARSTLETMGNDSTNRTYGIGSNKLSERGKSAGIQAYTDCLQRFALQGLLAWIIRVRKEAGCIDQRVIENEFLFSRANPMPQYDPISTVDWPIFPWETMDLNLWHYQRWLLQEEFRVDSRNLAWVIELLNKLVGLEKDFAYRVYKSKKRDDIRGSETIPNYAEAHVAAGLDPVIVEARTQAEKTEKMVGEISGLMTRSRL